MTHSLAARWTGLFLLGVPALCPDGDPLEVYEFTGKPRIEEFVQQSETHVLQHGLWTVQRYVEFDPFAGEYWALRSNRKERVCVYYGTRPMWASEPSYSSRITSVGFPSGDELAPRFSSALRTTEHDAELRVVDCTGRAGITILIQNWSGGANRGSSAELIRLSGDTPAAAKVESLWNGLYQEFEDVDGDGLFEIIDTDWAHDYAEYLPGTGSWKNVTLKWEREQERYVILELPPRAPLIEKRRARTRIELKPDVDRVHTLANDLTDLIWNGELAAARQLFEETRLRSFGARYSGDPYCRDEWWEAYVVGCKSSRYWTLLCAQFPQLHEL